MLGLLKYSIYCTDVNSVLGDVRNSVQNPKIRACGCLQKWDNRLNEEAEFLLVSHPSTNFFASNEQTITANLELAHDVRSAICVVQITFAGLHRAVIPNLMCLRV